MEQLCKTLLKEWCEALLRLQIQNPERPDLHGAIWCPACQRIHGRCFEAMYPFLCMAEQETKEEQKERWIQAAGWLFEWAERNVSRPEGFFYNDTDNGWKGTTVFNAIQLADCLHFHGALLPETVKSRWTARLRKAAEYLYAFDELKETNVNYPISNALALYECGLVLGEGRYLEKAAEFAQIGADSFTGQGILTGEGVPKKQRSKRGCLPADIGYNVEESLPSLALYGILSGQAVYQELAEQGLKAHLELMLEDGGWDNSFGTRNFKWTYWGSRTSDGCGLGYLLFADRNPEFAAAAERNLKLLKACTWDGLLMGGPHYHAAGQKACVHHTFTHAKVLAAVLDRGFLMEGKEDSGRESREEGCRGAKNRGASMLLPRQRTEGLRRLEELDSWIAVRKHITGTVTAYDWEYLPGGHVSGGTLSLLYHTQAGPLLCASVGEYSLKEPNNMQIPQGVRHECLAPRIEAEKDGVVYSSIYEDRAVVVTQENEIAVTGVLKDIRHQALEEAENGRKQPSAYRFRYHFLEDGVEIEAEFQQGRFICPLVSRGDERIEMAEDRRSIQIEKETAVVEMRADNGLEMPYGTERIFHLVPGFQAVRVETEGKRCRITILVKEIHRR